jgi:hypothetical protein
MLYSIAGGVGVGALAARLYIRFFQAADQRVLYPPTLLPRIAWDHIARISAIFVAVLVVAQGVVISTALRRGVFQALGWGTGNDGRVRIFRDSLVPSARVCTATVLKRLPTGERVILASLPLARDPAARPWTDRAAQTPP